MTIERIGWTVLFGVSLITAIASPGHASAPSQFIAKTYTEALGRLPTETEWASAHTALEGTQSATTLRVWAKQAAYMSVEYDLLYKTGTIYDNAARVLTIYRGILNREPDINGFNTWRTRLDNGSWTWSQVVDAFFGSPEFSTLVNKINGQVTYGWGTHSVIDMLPAGTPKWTVVYGLSCGTPVNYSQSELQACLNNLSNSGGGAVALTPKAVIRLTSTLTVPGNVLLFTLGSPPHTRYATFARLVRNGDFLTPVVEVQTGGQMTNVWIDGQRTHLGGPFGTIGGVAEADNVHMTPADNVTSPTTPTIVSGCVLSNSASWLNLFIKGKVNGPGRSTYFEAISNLVTGYSSCHTNHEFCDGISVSNEGAIVAYNEIVDASDVGITIFRTKPELSQDSKIRFNKILAAGNSGWAGIGVDTGQDLGLEPPGGYRFDELEVESNTIFTGNRAHFDVGLMIGTTVIPWSTHSKGTGAAFRSNVLGLATVPAFMGISAAVNGMLNTEFPVAPAVGGNVFHARLLPQSAGVTQCGSATLAANGYPYTAWSSFVGGDPPDTDRNGTLWNCLGHADMWCEPPPPCPDPPCEIDPAPESERIALVVEPSPSYGTTRFRLEGPRERLEGVSVYDVAGRLIVKLVARTGDRDSRRLVWDGRGRDGIAVRAGVYRYVAWTSRGNFQGHFTLLR